MFELPEFINLARQMNETLRGKKIQAGQLGNTPHKFVWYNCSHEEFARLTKGRTVGRASARGKWLFIPLEPDYLLLLGECGGKVLYHARGVSLPKKYHLYLTFEDGSFLTATTVMWGAMELYEQGYEQNRQYIKDMRTTPVEPGFTYEYFQSLLHAHEEGAKWSLKALLTQDQMIPGLGNAIAQDILFRARLDPRHAVQELTPTQSRLLYAAIMDTVKEVIACGGRYDEFDLFNRRGKYARLMDRHALERPCPACGGVIKKIQYLGGACYICSKCQQ